MKSMEKYLFSFHDQQVPVGYVAQDDRLSGLRLAATSAGNGKVQVVPGTEWELGSPLVVSSIGSVPEPIPGLPMTGEAYLVRDAETGELDGVPGVFAVGNAVTGKGNIVVSARHGRLVSQHMLEHYLQGTASGYEEVLADAATESQSRMSAVAARLAAQPMLSADHVAALLARVRTLQERVGYAGDYRAWIGKTHPQ